MGDGRRRRGRLRSDGVDRISCLPDDLLHVILLRLRSTRDAVRTSVLSRRWRRVWAQVPELSFDLDGDQLRPSSILHGIDAVIAAYSARTLDRIEISLDDRPPMCVAPLLRLASLRLGGQLTIRLGDPSTLSSYYDDDLEVPACEGATGIDLQLLMHLRLAPTGSFAELRVLRIDCDHLHDGDLDRALSKQCPRLQELSVSTYLRPDHAVSIRSDSLERLKLGGGVADGQITVDALKLVRLEMLRTIDLDWDDVGGARIAAPELSELIWQNVYDSHHDQIVGTKSHLRKLEVLPPDHNHLYPLEMSALFKRFDYVDELSMHIEVYHHANMYSIYDCEGCLMDVPKLPQCRVLTLHLLSEGSKDNFVKCMLHVLRKCVGIKRLNVCLMNPVNVQFWKQEVLPTGQLTTNDSIVLDSLEEIELSSERVRQQGEGHLLRLLLLICRTVPQKVVVHATDKTPYLKMSTCVNIANFCHPETSVKFYRHLGGRYGLMWARKGQSRATKGKQT